MLQLNGMGNQLCLSGKVWAMSAIDDQFTTLQCEDMTTVTYYAVTLPTPHAAGLL